MHDNLNPVPWRRKTRVGTLDDMKDLVHGLFKVAIILVRHKMGDHFCVSFGFELMALLQKIQFEGHVIFDDAIMDNAIHRCHPYGDGH